MSEKRIAVVSILVEKREMSQKVNEILSGYGEFIVGRMGIPYRERNLSVICVVIDAPAETVNGLTGKLGMIDGVIAKTLMNRQ